MIYNITSIYSVSAYYAVNIKRMANVLCYTLDPSL